MSVSKKSFVAPVLLTAGMILAGVAPALCAAPPSAYKSTSKTTVRGVQYYVNLPGDYSASKKYFLCVSHSGAGPVTHRLWCSGDLCGYGEAVGFSPIYLAIDYGTDGAIPAIGDPLWARYKQALTDIQAEYPNTYPGIFMFGFSLGAAFVSHYAQKAPAETRILAICPNSSGDMALPTSRERNYMRVLFTCGSRDGNLTGMNAAVPVYKSFGYDIRLYIEPNLGHEVGDSSRYQTARFFKMVGDSLMKVTNIGRESYRVAPVSAQVQARNEQSIFTISGRVLPFDTYRAPEPVIITGRTRLGMAVGCGVERW